MAPPLRQPAALCALVAPPLTGPGAADAIDPSFAGQEDDDRLGLSYAVRARSFAVLVALRDGRSAPRSPMPKGRAK